MAQSTERLERYLEDELGECRSEDVDRRLDELGALEAALGPSRVETELDVLSGLANETRLTLVRSLVAAEANSASVNSTRSSTSVRAQSATRSRR
jgi:hypothetical protein